MSTNLKLYGLALLTSAVLVGACTKAADKVQPANGTQKPGQSGAPIGTQLPGDQDANASVNAAAIGVSDEDFKNGMAFVNGWDGAADQFASPVLWSLKDVVVVSQGPATGGAATPAATPGSTATKPADKPADKPATNSQVETTADGITFHIKKGTGNGAWNTKDTAAVLPAGKRLTIQNDDDTPHRWHTNGRPCQHGNEIAPGESETCTANSAGSFSGSASHDHITNGEFFLRVDPTVN